MKNKRFLCSRPVGCKTESKSNCADCFRDGIFTCNPLANNRVPKISNSSEKINHSESEIHHTRSRSFSAVVKALLFEISMRKKIRKSNKSPRPNLGFETKSPKSFADSNFQRIKRNSSESSSSSSSSNLFGPSYSSPLPENLVGRGCLKQRNQSTGKKVIGCWSSSNSELFVILVAFTITIFYGKLCAMLFTSMCLYFLTRRRIYERRPENLTIPSPGTKLQTTEFKKRVTMGGILKRNRQRLGN